VKAPCVCGNSCRRLWVWPVIGNIHGVTLLQLVSFLDESAHFLFIMAVGVGRKQYDSVRNCVHKGIVLPWIGCRCED
jgi:hypothetical protein